MNIYTTVFIILVFLFIMEDCLKKNKRIYKFFKIFIVILIICLVGFRGVIGPDSRAYYKTYLEVPLLKELTIQFLKSQYMESGYLVLNSFIKTMGGRFWCITFFITFINIINVTVFMNYFSKYFFYSLSFYYCRWLFLKEFIQIRNGLVSSFLYLALIFFYKKKYKLYVLIILFGSLFHKSILFALSYMLFDKIIKNRKYFNVIIITTYILPFVNLRFILDKIIGKIIGSNSIYLVGIYSHRNSHIVAFYSMFFLILLLFLKKYLKKENKTLFLIQIFIFSVLTGNVLYYYGDIGGRLSAFFNDEFVLQDKFIGIFKNRRVIKLILIIFLILLYKINFINRTFPSINPYVFFWE